jgi:serine/threonine protein kinase
MTVPLEDGDTFGDRYRLSSRISGGAMGDVWRATDILLGRQIAIKLLKSGLSTDDSFHERFRHEARAAARLSNPAIATVFDYGEEVGKQGQRIAYIVMEFVEGESLDVTLCRQGRLSPPETLDIVGQAAAGLQAAHERGVVHRDIKPGNLLIQLDGVLKITDFGIARVIDDPAITQTGMIFGTLHYMSPEQLSGRPATEASDIYALGVVAYQCLAGQVPFPGTESMSVALAHVRDTVPPLPSEVPGSVNAFVHDMLEKDPARRPESAELVAARARTLRSASHPVAVTTLDMDPTVIEPATGTTTRPLLLQAGVSSPTVRFGDGSSPLPTAVMPGVAPPPPRAHEPLRRYWIVGALLALFVFVLLVTLLPSAGLPGVVLPKMVGAKANAATAQLEKAGLHVHRQSVNGNHTAGVVLSQQPPAGRRVAMGSGVDLGVSSGFVDLTASQLVGQQYSRARPALVAMGLVPQEVTVATSEPSGTVLSLTPVGKLALGTAVSVQVAAAPAPVAPAGPLSSTAKSGHGKAPKN